MPIQAEKSDTGADSSAKIVAKPRPGSQTKSMRDALAAHYNRLGKRGKSSYFFNGIVLYMIL